MDIEGHTAQRKAAQKIVKVNMPTHEPNIKSEMWLKDPLNRKNRCIYIKHSQSYSLMQLNDFHVFNFGGKMLQTLQCFGSFLFTFFVYKY